MPESWLSTQALWEAETRLVGVDFWFGLNFGGVAVVELFVWGDASAQFLRIVRYLLGVFFVVVVRVSIGHGSYIDKHNGRAQ